MEPRLVTYTDKLVTLNLSRSHARTIFILAAILLSVLVSTSTVKYILGFGCVASPMPTVLLVSFHYHYSR